METTLSKTSGFLKSFNLSNNISRVLSTYFYIYELFSTNSSFLLVFKSPNNKLISKASYTNLGIFYYKNSLLSFQIYINS